MLKLFDPNQPTNEEIMEAHGDRRMDLIVERNFNEWLYPRFYGFLVGLVVGVIGTALVAFGRS